MMNNKMTVNGWFELDAKHDRCKSFYGKAHVSYVYDNYGLCGMILKSYDTDVLYLSAYGSVHKLWDDYSVTTMRHINEFINQYNGGKGGGKKWWDSLPTETIEYTEKFEFRMS